MNKPIADAELGARVKQVFVELTDLIRDNRHDSSYVTQQALVQMRITHAFLDHLIHHWSDPIHDHALTSSSRGHLVHEQQRTDVNEEGVGSSQEHAQRDVLDVPLNLDG